MACLKVGGCEGKLKEILTPEALDEAKALALKAEPDEDAAALKKIRKRLKRTALWRDPPRRSGRPSRGLRAGRRRRLAAPAAKRPRRGAAPLPGTFVGAGSDSAGAARTASVRTLRRCAGRWRRLNHSSRRVLSVVHPSPGSLGERAPSRLPAGAGTQRGSCIKLLRGPLCSPDEAMKIIVNRPHRPRKFSRRNSYCFILKRCPLDSPSFLPLEIAWSKDAICQQKSR